MRSKKIGTVAVEGNSIILPTYVKNYVRATEEIMEEFTAAVPAPAALGALARFASWMLDSPYHEDLADVAAATGISKNTLTLANYSYELTPFGCTTRVDTVRGHLRVRRTLDWSLLSLGKHSWVVENTELGCTNVTFPGFVGAVTAMRDAEYAVVVNAAPNNSLRTGWQPLMLVRWAIENCATYSEAVYTLTHTPLTAGVFFTVVGTKSACIIERTPRDARVRRYRGEPLVVSNHYVHRDFSVLNDPDAVVDSADRRNDFGASAEAWTRAPILNDTTVQAIELIPATSRCAAISYTH